MPTIDLPEMSETRLNPQLAMGAASPLWGYYAVAAASGVAYWWMTRWTRPMNLEAMFAGVAEALPETEALVEAAAQPVVEAVEAVAELTTETVAEIVEEAPVPVGGEAAPISPLVEALAAPEPALEAAPEPVVEPEPAPKPRAKKAAPILEDEA